MNYSEYSTAIGMDPSYYGANCTEQRAAEIARDLTKIIEQQFPGIKVSASGRTSGPDSKICDEINEWIWENWTSVL